MNLFCLIFGHSPVHPHTKRYCRRKGCSHKFKGYCDHKWLYEPHEDHSDIYFYDSDPYAQKPVSYEPKEGYCKWHTTTFSNLKCEKCGVRQFSMEYEKYLSGEWK